MRFTTAIRAFLLLAFGTTKQVELTAIPLRNAFHRRKKILQLSLLLMGTTVSLPAFAQFPGCPDVNAGADQTLTCNQTCANLTATPFHAGATTSYTVGAIPHTPPLPYNQAGGTAVSVGADDVFSPIINLPFNFCYYGVTYNTCKIGSNCTIKLGPASGAGSNPWPFSVSCPSTSLTAAGDIFGVYHDVDPTKGPNPGTIRWYVTGSAPCRIFVVIFDNLAHFGSSCSSGTYRSTSMIVLYETTNAIDIYVQAKPLCTSWNSGHAILGIQNPAGTSGMTAPNRNTTPNWTVSTPEAWRFTPSGTPIYTVDWLQGGTVIASGATTSVCPSAPTIYTARATYTSCDGTVIVEQDDVTVNPSAAAPSLTQVSITGASCGQSNGSLQVAGSGGAGGYTYSINNGATFQPGGTFSNLAVGNYTINVQDVNGCSGVLSLAVPATGAVALNLVSQANPACNGSANGQVVTSATGGDGNYTFTINGGASQPAGTFASLGAGTYTIVVTDGGGCTDNEVVTLTNPPALTIAQASNTPAACLAANGSVGVTAAGGSGSYQYSINSGSLQGSSTFGTLTAGSYTVLVQDANLCTASLPVTITSVNNLNANLTGQTNITCAGQTNGTATVTGSGNPGPYNFQLGSGPTQPSGSFSNLAAGTYIITVTDANSCSDNVSVTITQPSGINVTTNNAVAVCVGTPAMIQANATGGSGTIANYTWTPGAASGSSISVSPVATTTYTVTATDGNGCQNTGQVVVTVNPLPLINAGPDQSLCEGGLVTLSGTGGTGYSWSNSVLNGSPFTPVAGTTTYTVTGTGAGGCVNTDQVTVTVNALPVVNAGPNQAVCPGTSVTLQGTGAASYSWSNGISNAVPFTPSSTQTYVVTGTSPAGCVSTDQVLVTVNIPPLVSAGLDQPVCIGGNITLSGTGAATYTWNNGVTNGVAFSPTSTQTYTVTGTDVNGCQGTDQVIVTVNPLPVIGAGVDQTICDGSQAVLSGAGGVSYSWTSGVTNSNPFTPAVGSVTYTVTGTDVNGCQGTDQVTVNVVPAPVSVITSAGPITGYPGLIVVFGNESENSNGFGWNFDNGQTTTTSDTSITTQSQFNSPGTYDVVLTASNGICQDQSSLQVIVMPFEPMVINVPNIFTPDGDGINDFFFIDVENGVSINIAVVNRWGNNMIELKDLTEKWDGTVNGNPADEGTYFFTYSILGKDGNTLTGHGFVELMK